MHDILVHRELSPDQLGYSSSELACCRRKPDLVDHDAYVAPGSAWLPDTGSWDGPWYTSGDRLGFGNVEISNTTVDCVHVWACIYGTVTADGTSAGYTLVLPQNPYGAGD